MKKILNEKNIILFIIFISMLSLNYLYPYISDDYTYMYKYDNFERIKNISDIFFSMKDHYFLWGGRVLAHSLASVFLLLPKNIFNICNSIMYTIFIYMIYLIGRRNNKDNYNYLFIIHLLIWFINISFGEVTLWLTGSCNYLWTSVIILLFLYLFHKENKNVIIFSILGILAGMCNENFSLSIIFVCILFVIFNKNYRNKNNYIGIIFLIIGYLFLFLAPGNFIRASAGVNNIITITQKILYLIKVFSLLIIFILLLSYVLYKKNKLKKDYLIYILGSIICILFLVVAPTFSLRATIGTLIYNLIIIIDILFSFKFDLNKYIYLILGVIYLISYLYTLQDTYNLNKYINNLNNFKNKDVVINRYKRTTKRVINLDMFNSYKNDIINKKIAKYYHLKSIKFIK